MFGHIAVEEEGLRNHRSQAEEMMGSMVVEAAVVCIRESADAQSEAVHVPLLSAGSTYW